LICVPCASGNDHPVLPIAIFLPESTKLIRNNI
jgi:hypothetical protein